MSSREHSKDFKTGKINFVCQYCADYSCLTSDKHIYDKRDGAQCDYCNFWIHMKRDRLSTEKYDKLVHNCSELLYCRNCTQRWIQDFLAGGLKAFYQI